MKRYKLIKKLPFENSPEIGYISTSISENTHYWNHNWFQPSDYPNYWEEVVEKDYKILSFINIDTKIEVILHDNGLYCSTASHSYEDQGKLTLEECLSEKCLAIYKVKRSDGEVFTLNDNVCLIDKTKLIGGKIYYLKIDEDGFGIQIGFDKGNWNYINNIKHSKKPLFTTADGVDIFEGDEYFYVCDSNYFETNFKYRIFEASTDDDGRILDLTDESIHRFSTREKAEEYIYWNEPVLSLNEVATIYKGLTYLRDNTPQKPGQQALDLLELVKSKYE
jgi:hypothetical protein